MLLKEPVKSGVCVAFEYQLNERISFDLYLKPMACPRPRVAGRFAYMPSAYIQWKNRCKTFLRQQYKGKTIEKPVFIDITAIYQRPKSLMRKKDPEKRILKTTKPDIDNIVKACLDALQDAKILKDDSQVVGIIAHKWYGSKIEEKKSERSSIKIDIYPIDGE